VYLTQNYNIEDDILHDDNHDYLSWHSFFSEWKNWILQLNSNIL